MEQGLGAVEEGLGPDESGQGALPAVEDSLRPEELLALDGLPATEGSAVPPPPPPRARMLPPKPPRPPGRTPLPFKPVPRLITSPSFGGETPSVAEENKEAIAKVVENEITPVVVEEIVVPAVKPENAIVPFPTVVAEKNPVPLASEEEEKEIFPFTQIAEEASAFAEEPRPRESSPTPVQVSSGDSREFLLRLLEAKTRSDLLSAENASLRAALDSQQQLDAVLLRNENERLTREASELSARLTTVERQNEAFKTEAEERFRAEQARLDRELLGLKARFSEALADARLREASRLTELGTLRTERELLRAGLTTALARVRSLEESVSAASSAATQRDRLYDAVERLAAAAERAAHPARADECSKLYAEVAALLASRTSSTKPQQTEAPPAPARTSSGGKAPTAFTLPVVEDYSGFFDAISFASEHPSPPSTPSSSAKREVRNIFRKA